MPQYVAAGVIENIEKVGFRELKLIQFDKTWVIEKYNKNMVYESPIFSIGRSQKLQWRFRLNSVNSVWPSLVLLPCTSISSMTVKHTFSLLNANGEKELNFSTQSYQKPVLASSITEYRGQNGSYCFLHDDVFGSSREIISSGKLTLFCEIELVVKPSDLSEDFGVIKVPSCDLIDDIGDLLKAQTFTDFAINVKGKEFPVHKNVLAARSPVFDAMFRDELRKKREDRTEVVDFEPAAAIAAMFENELREKREDRVEAREKREDQVEVIDIEPAVFEEMLRFMYTGRAPNLDKMADKLLMAAEKYQLERLKLMCEEALRTKISVDNVVDLLMLADLQNAKHLRKRAINFISGSKFPEILETESFRTFAKSCPDLVIEILQHKQKV